MKRAFFSIFFFLLLLNGGGATNEKNALENFYKERLNQPIWITENGLTPCGQEAVQILGSVAQEGLDPKRYASLLSQLAGIDEASFEERLRLDRELTGAILYYISTVGGERNNFRSFDKDLYLKEKQIDEFDVLAKGLSSNGCEWMRQLAPQHAQYQGLIKVYASYLQKKKEGGWPSLPPDISLKKGDRDPFIKQLRQQLIAQDALQKDQADSLIFDERIETALRNFQLFHGLQPTGLLDKESIKELNISVETRLKEIALNLERWRWLPMELGERYLIVNIPTYELHGIDKGKTILSMPIIVGQAYRRTPIFTSMMTAIILNPPWTVPHSIAIKDKLPLFLKYPGLLSARKYRVFAKDGREEIPIQSIKWASLSKNNFPYVLRQDPGPHNALGKTKFYISNSFQIYLHGTPDQKMFKLSKRAKSSGCIRVASPNALALFALNGNPKWTLEALEKATLTNTTQSIFLSQPLPVYITYMTVWIDEKGHPHFAQDIYRKNESVEKLMRLQAQL